MQAHEPRPSSPARPQVDPFPRTPTVIRRRVARRRHPLGLDRDRGVDCARRAVVATTRSQTTSRLPASKEIQTRELPRLDAIVVLPSQSTDADAAQVRATLDSTGAVKAYPLRSPPPLSLCRSLGLGRE